jgi:aryl-alcohol dehydrogenase-like predicted oxidoreductase
LRRSVVTPIAGTSSLAYLDENLDSAALELNDDEYASLGG